MAAPLAISQLVPVALNEMIDGKAPGLSKWQLFAEEVAGIAIKATTARVSMWAGFFVIQSSVVRIHQPATLISL